MKGLKLWKMSGKGFLQGDSPVDFTRSRNRFQIDVYCYITNMQDGTTPNEDGRVGGKSNPHAGDNGWLITEYDSNT